MKKIQILLPLLVLIFSSCLKDTTIKNGLDEVGSVVMIQNSGLNDFSAAAVVTAGAVNPITKSFTINIANADGSLTTSDLTVNLFVDDSKRLSYNGLPLPALDYEIMPDSVYNFPKRSVVITAGKNLATLDVTFYPDKINPSKLYMLPISIKDAGGKNISGNLSTVYYHIIGNPLAGNYVTTGMRYNYNNFPGGVVWAGPPAPYPAGSTDGTTSAYNTTVLALPVDASTIKLVFGNVPDPAPVGGAAYYYITGTDAAFSGITYDFGSNFNAGYSNIQKYVITYTQPTATQKAKFRLVTKYNNNATIPLDRLIDQTFTQQ